ncbi:TetR/AcrR family transcriptional regulator [Raoultibacter phocaeensis]|uniref:TetR/AcrR family transcriptional regulator n=1 Tax=Raoultibacter phocaeensis TaxID=2479841 RepID=UPI00111B3DB1|nr:TetR family transcriptional regulator [Raoultibacter phocaeensis]
MPKKKQQKQPLSRQLIVDTAFRMIDENGYDSFTMRALGSELGVSAMAFYAHFSSREEMLGAVGTKFMDALNTGPVAGERWDDTLRRTMTSLRAGYLEHPNVAEINNDNAIAWLGLAKHTEKIVNLHLSQGMPEDIFVKAWAMVDAFLTGFTANELAMIRDAAMPGSPDEGDLPKWQQVVRSAYTDESFASGIEIIIEGVRGLAAPDPCEWYTPDERGDDGSDTRGKRDAAASEAGIRSGTAGDTASKAMR